MGEPFINLDKRIRVLSAGFIIIDDFSNDVIHGNMEFLVDGKSVVPVLNRSGYFLFCNLTTGNHVVTIRAKGFNETSETLLVPEGSSAGIRSVRLVPLPSYPFPSGTTIFRGAVFARREGGSEPVKAVPLVEVAVRLAVKGKELQAITAANGEFVMYLPRLNDSASKRVDGKLFIRGVGDTVELAPMFVKEGHQDGDLFLIKDDIREKVDSFRMEVGKELRIRKYLTWGG